MLPALAVDIEEAMDPKESYAIRVYKQYFNFASSHFLIFADGSREPLHGHNYQVQVKVEGDVVEGDLVIDFIPFKPMVKQLCDDLDHCMLLPRHNPYLEVMELDDRVEVKHTDGSFFSFPKKDTLILDLPNTSTEMLARHLARAMARDIPVKIPEARVHAIEVEVEESGGQCGVCRLDLTNDAA